MAFIRARQIDRLFVSAVTLAELRFGIELVTDAGYRAELHEWLTHKMRPMFDQRVLQVSEDVMFKWRLMVEEGRKSRHTFSQPDLIIAATAAHHDLVIVTRNVSDYRLTRVPVFDPWTESVPASG